MRIREQQFEFIFKRTKTYISKHIVTIDSDNLDYAINRKMNCGMKALIQTENHIGYKHIELTSRSFALFFYILAIVMPAKAQSEDKYLFRQFEERFALLDSLIFQYEINIPSEHIHTFKLLSKDSASVQSLDSIMDEKVALQIKAMKAETGLLISGQTYYRLDEGFGINDDDALSSYKAKVQAELRWNFLSSSLVNRKSRTRELLIKGELEEIALERERTNKFIEQQKEFFQTEFDSLLSGVLKLRISNLQLLNDAQQYLVSDRSISTDELLKIMDEQAIAVRQFAAIPKDYSHQPQLANPYGTLIEIDTASMMRHIRSDESSLITAELQMELLQQQMKHTNYWRTLNLSPFIRYSYYARPDMRNSSNVDAGLAFQVPISAETSRKKKALKAEQLQISMEKDFLMEQVCEQTRIILLDIERANKGLAGEVNRISKLKNYMELRKQNYKEHIGEYNFMSRIKEYNHYLKCWENFYTYQHKRDCCIADLQKFLSDKSVLDFCKITFLDL